MKKAVSVLLSLALLLTLSVPAWAYPDVAGDHPAQAAIQRWSDYGLVIGDEKGEFDPEGSLTRAAFATILDRLMGYQVQAENTFSDLKEGDWYLDAVLRLNAAGVLEGAEGRAMPNGVLTRQEAAALAGRVLGLEEGDKELSFADKTAVADWAAGWVSALAGRGCFAGETSFRPTEPMTRAEAVSMLDTLISAFVHADGTYSADAAGDVVVNAKDVTLKDMKIGGDLIVADGVADGDVYLDHVTVAGKIVLRGGGDHSFHLLPGTEVKGTIIVTKTASGGIRLVNESGKVLPMVNVADGKDGVTLTGDFDQVVVATDAAVELADASVKTAVSVTVPGASVSVTGKSEVKKLDVAETAKDAAVSIDKTAKVKAVDVAADGLTLDNQSKTQPTLTVDKTVTEKPKDSTGSDVKPAPTPSPSPSGPSGPTTLSAVTANLASPQAAKAATDAVPAGSGYTVATTWEPELVGGKFAKDTAYTATLVFSLASSSYQWGSTVNVEVNNSTSYGTDAQMSAPTINTETKTVTVTAAYAKTAANLSLVVDAQPEDVTATEGNTTGKSVSVRAHVLADGAEAANYPVSYQWYQATQSDMSGKKAISGATAAECRLPVLEKGTYYFACIMTADGVVEIMSEFATITVNAAPQGAVVLSNVQLALDEESLILKWDTNKPEYVKYNFSYLSSGEKLEDIGSRNRSCPEAQLPIGPEVIFLNTSSTIDEIQITPVNDNREPVGATVSFGCSIDVTKSAMNGAGISYNSTRKVFTFQGLQNSFSGYYFMMVSYNGLDEDIGFGAQISPPEEGPWEEQLDYISDEELAAIEKPGTTVQL